MSEKRAVSHSLCFLPRLLEHLLLLLLLSYKLYNGFSTYYNSLQIFCIAFPSNANAATPLTPCSNTQRNVEEKKPAFQTILKCMLNSHLSLPYDTSHSLNFLVAICLSCCDNSGNRGRRRRRRRRPSSSGGRQTFYFQICPKNKLGEEEEEE